MTNRPNIIFILADDMGYGDLGANNPASKIPTPHLDRLATEGMRFTDAHAGSSVCSPSRYNVLTGRYCWRSRLRSGIVWEFDGPMIDEGQPTVASLLKAHSYHTACLGKWHMGWDWPTTDGAQPNETLTFGVREADKRLAMCERIDWQGLVDGSARLGGGPVDRGFDHYFGVDVPNFAPYTWFEDDRLTEAPTQPKPDSLYGNPGPAVAGWSLEPMIPEFTRRAVDYIEGRAGETDPFFLYFPLTSPHSPVVPNEAFRGMSGAGNYGDFVCEVDWVVGQVCAALQRSGQADDTLIIFTSDNGPERRVGDDIGCYERVEAHDHYSMGDLRGMKRDAWEGGHRVPYIARWPGVTPAGSVCEQTIVLGDLMATCAEITGASLAAEAGEDSISALPLLRGEVDAPTRGFTVHHSMTGTFALRQEGWVYIDGHGGDNEEPAVFRQRRGYVADDHPAELYDLGEDLSERRNRWADEPQRVQRMAALLARAKGGDHPSAAHLPDDELTE
jgi:arylsulfatase A